MGDDAGDAGTQGQSGEGVSEKPENIIRSLYGSVCRAVVVLIRYNSDHNILNYWSVEIIFACFFNVYKFSIKK